VTATPNFSNRSACRQNRRMLNRGRHEVIAGAEQAEEGCVVRPPWPPELKTTSAVVAVEELGERGPGAVHGRMGLLAVEVDGAWALRSAPSSRGAWASTTPAARGWWRWPSM